LAAILAIGKPVAFEASAETTANARIHFDDNHAPTLRIDRELDVGTPVSTPIPG